MAIYIGGSDGKAHAVRSIWVGNSSGEATAVTAGFIGDNSGHAKVFFQAKTSYSLSVSSTATAGTPVTVQITNITGGIPPYTLTIQTSTSSLGPFITEGTVSNITQTSCSGQIIFSNAGTHYIRTVLSNSGGVGSGTSQEASVIVRAALGISVTCSPSRVASGSTLQVSWSISGGTPPYCSSVSWHTNSDGTRHNVLNGSSNTSCSFAPSFSSASTIYVEVTVTDAEGITITETNSGTNVYASESGSILQITGTNVRVRSSASTASSSNILSEISFGGTCDYYLYSGTTSGSGYTWYIVTNEILQENGKYMKGDNVGQEFGATPVYIAASTGVTNLGSQTIYVNA